jgi:hypothetical protein
MRMNLITMFVTCAFVGLAAAACDKIPGLGQGTPAPAQPAPAAVPQVPAIPQAAPPAAPPAPIAPAAVPVPATPPVPVAPAVTPPPAPTGDELVDLMNATQQKVAADRVATGGAAPTRMELKKGKKQSYDVQLPGPPFCHTYVAVGGKGVENLDISIASPAGAVEGSDSTEDATPVIANHCPTTPGNYRLTITMTKGSGEFAVQVFSK